MRGRPIWLALYALALVLLWPGDAFAWGPAAHIDFGLEVLKGAALLAPFLRRILHKHPDDYLYGCVAADIIVGKNMARYLHHCHNWQVALKILYAAADERQKALCYGFLTHLGADTIAHNFYVPYKTVESFRTNLAKHTYWELRFDQIKVHRHREVGAELARVGRLRFPDHDAFLQEMLVGACRLFSFRTSRRVFHSMMLLSRLAHWQRMMNMVAERSSLPLGAEEFEDFDHLAKQAVSTFLHDLEHSSTVRVDPTGARNLRAARELRRELRELRIAHRFDEARWPAAAAELRAAFRRSVHGRLDLPDVVALVAPHGRRSRRPPELTA